ncbi:uncharacterized protein [Euphorbia lathyris]|uniref:uncharacterized protein isoform X2 n=1 Tax=Euphorbia lathyris TaxID=212925 RepID=UPI0033135999
MNRLKLFFSLLFILLLSSSAANSHSGGSKPWQILTNHNFSSQIRLHPHILLFLSVPWSGESRSLMKEISRLVSDREDDLGPLMLMYMQRNKEKILADAIGATDGITIIYYHHSFAYKYQGKLVARNIISSILPYISASPDDIPLTPLTSEEDLKTFLQSTDKALLLHEFCGWTRKLLANKKRNGTSVFGLDSDTVRISESQGKENQKEAEKSSFQCDTQDGFSVIPGIGEFSADNASSAFQYTGNIATANSGVSSCTFEEFKKFDSFFSSFMNVARELFLPSERYRFGLVSEIPLVSSLLAEDSGSWSTMLYYNGCPSCSKILKEGDDLKTFLLKNDESIVKELERDGHDLDPAIHANKPSVLLFVDRFSDSSKTKRNSKEALDILRKLALQHKVSDQKGQENGNKSQKSSAQALQDYKSIAGHPKLKLSPMAQKVKLKEKMSVMIVNDGKHAILDNLASDLQGSSLQEILTYLLQQKKEVKLSSVAKEVGFRLLSDDMDIKLADKLPLEPQVESTQVSAPPSEEDFASTGGNMNKDSASEHKKELHYTSQDVSEPTLSETSDQLVSDEGLVISEDVKRTEEKGYVQVDLPEEEELKFRSFGGSFYVSEGNYRLLRALTDGTRIPSLVIIDPISQLHYVFPKHEIFNYSSVEDFLYRFLNGLLIPYQHSESASENSKEGPSPPFLNVDFHEADSVPRITSQTFSEQVLGFNESDNGNASDPWKEDVLILFSNSWCGFCQRMELVVREVCRAIKVYILKTGSLDREILHKDDNLKNAVKFPKIFLMDCTLNDCSLILKTNNQREVYPALLLFPAERKTPVPYEGDMAVADVIKFVVDHGSSSHHLIGDRGILPSVAEKRGRNQFKDAAIATAEGEASIKTDKSLEIQLKNQMGKRTVYYSQMKASRSKDEHDPEVLIGSILVATDKLVHPFDKSMVVIIKADKSTGFQGLIFNKLIRWDAVEDLDEGSEIVKEAPLSFGGPLIRRGMPLVALTRRAVGDEYPEVAAGIHFVDQTATLNEIEQLKSGNQSVSDYWFFLGFSSWGWDQLFDEIAEGAWNINANQTGNGNLDWPSSSLDM